MKRFLSLVAILAALTSAATEYDYNVVYHLGFIEKVAGHARLCVDLQGDTVRATVSGHSIPWGGVVYTVTDTLTAVCSPAQETILKRTGRYTKPSVGTSSVGTPYRTIDGEGTLDASPTTMEAVTLIADMMSLNGYAHTLPLAKMMPGEVHHIPVYIDNGDGENAGVDITFRGRDVVTDALGRRHPVYLLTVNYTYRGEPSQYDVQCAIDAEGLYPVTYAADIAIGHVEMRLL